MTLGSRIAQKRKEQGLSQEALGDVLGVSRQAIYKWESDSALPEIEKLVALSGHFGVSVGWLLGVEEASAAPPDSSELTEAQLNMVKEIVAQYLAAQPKAKPRRWPVLLLLAVLVLAGGMLLRRMDTMTQEYNNLRASVTNMSLTVNNEIQGISYRVEELLKAQNSLTAEYGTEISATVLEKNQIRFSVYAVPKTYVEGMSVSFSVDNHTGGVNKAAGEEGMNHRFTATLAAGLTDEITLSATLIYPDGTQQTQVLDTYTYLYSDTIPSVHIHDDLWRVALSENGVLHLPTPYNELRYAYFHNPQPNEYGVEITEARVGLFRNRTLVAWGTACDVPENYHGFDDCTFFEFSPLELPLAMEDTVCFAAVLTDQFGRTFVSPGSICSPQREDGELLLNHADVKHNSDWVWDYD